MATRPQFSPQFAFTDVQLPEAGTDNKLRPPVEIREVGYDYLQKPPAQEFNWIVNNLGQWIQYLDDLTREQGITEIASRQQAEDGVATDVLMTPQRTLQSIQYNAVPPGTVMHYAASTAPSGWRICDGSVVSRTTYSRLFNAIGTTFGAGDGSTTFGLPDLRNEFIRGADISGGRSVGDAETDSLASHAHSGTTASAGTHNHTYPKPNNTERAEIGNGSTAWFTYGGGSDGTTASAGAHTHSFTTNNTGGTETRPQNVALLPIIKT